MKLNLQYEIYLSGNKLFTRNFLFKSVINLMRGVSRGHFHIFLSAYLYLFALNYENLNYSPFIYRRPYKKDTRCNLPKRFLSDYKEEGDLSFVYVQLLLNKLKIIDF